MGQVGSRPSGPHGNSLSKPSKSNPPTKAQGRQIRWLGQCHHPSILPRKRTDRHLCASRDHHVLLGFRVEDARLYPQPDALQPRHEFLVAIRPEGQPLRTGIDRPVGLELCDSNLQVMLVLPEMFNLPACGGRWPRASAGPEHGQWPTSPEEHPRPARPSASGTPASRGRRDSWLRRPSTVPRASHREAAHGVARHPAPACGGNRSHPPRGVARGVTDYGVRDSPEIHTGNAGQARQQVGVQRTWSLLAPLPLADHVGVHTDASPARGPCEFGETIGQSLLGQPERPPQPSDHQSLLTAVRQPIASPGIEDHPADEASWESILNRCRPQRSGLATD